MHLDLLFVLNPNLILVFLKVMLIKKCESVSEITFQTLSIAINLLKTRASDRLLRILIIKNLSPCNICLLKMARYNLHWLVVSHLE